MTKASDDVEKLMKEIESDAKDKTQVKPLEKPPEPKAVAAVPLSCGNCAWAMCPSQKALKRGTLLKCRRGMLCGIGQDQLITVNSEETPCPEFVQQPKQNVRVAPK